MREMQPHPFRLGNPSCNLGKTSCSEFFPLKYGDLAKSITPQTS